ncbi:MAG: class I SAM-dependent methyltransferase [Actinomycetota bacterium]|nr:class I SAM-dependent methyltransferase [Actinomycetota bacterium]
MLLLHSLAEFRELILESLEIAGARTIVEIGSEEAAFTRELLAWVERNDGELHCVEPYPSPALRELSRASEALHLVEGRSPGVLESLWPCDAYVIDGDHNYATVLQELLAIDQVRAPGRPGALVFVHDIGWPCGRRDMYYSPKSLAPDVVHPFTYDHGVTLGCSKAVKGGHRGEGRFAWAVEEGGRRNGVLTAVEDFLDERDDLVFIKVPCIFGLGIIFPRSSRYAERMANFLAFYDENVLLDRLEQNRLTLYLRVLELQDEKEGVIRGLQDAHLHIRDLDAENRGLWARTTELEGQVQRLSGRLASMSGELVTMLHSRAFAVAERLSRLRRRATSEGPGLSRQRLQAVLEGEQRG